MNRARWRLTVTCLAVIGAAIAVAGGSAGNRNGTGTLVPVPGPGSVTYGENIAYKATFSNDNTSSGAVFTQTKYVMPPPVAPGGVPVTPVASSCGAFDANNVLTCEFGQLRPGQSVELTVVWNVRADPSKPGCSVSTVTSCLNADGTWLIKEGKPTNLNESFPVNAKASLIGTSVTDPVNANQRAGGYELTGCGAQNPTSLTTNQALDATTNPIATSFCLPASFLPTGAAGGVATTITEPSSSAANYARHSEVCIAQPGANCPDGAAATFGGEFIVFTFRVADGALPKGFKITQVFHNSLAQALPDCAVDSTKPDGCVVSIVLDQKTKIWTIVAKAKTNGPWDW